MLHVIVHALIGLILLLQHTVFNSGLQFLSSGGMGCQTFSKSCISPDLPLIIVETSCADGHSGHEDFGHRPELPDPALFFLLSRDGVAGLPPEIDGGFRANV